MQTLLLHICCGPCATAVIERLRDDYDLTGFFYNPNIDPPEEYERRLEACREVCRRMNVPLVEGDYDSGRFLETVRGLESEPENGARCPVCFRLRLNETARVAREKGFDLIASTLTIGPMKKAAVINPIGFEEAEAHSLVFLDGDWKKRDGFKRSCELSREFDIYRQHYCGCRFSLRNSDDDHNSGA